MKTEATTKRWTRTEWLLLLAPLFVVVGLGAMQFAPQLSRAWSEWREYGSNRPYAVFYPQVKSKKPLVPYLGIFAFSPDGQQIAISETLSLGSAFGYATRVWLWKMGESKPLRSWSASEDAKLQNAETQVAQLHYENEILSVFTNSRWPSRDLTKQKEQVSIEEKRDARNGRLISRKQRQSLLEADSPTKLNLLIPSSGSLSPIRFHQRKKNGISVKVSFQQTAMWRPQNHASPGKKYVKVRFFADVTDAKKHSRYRLSLANFDDIPRTQGDSSKNIGVAFSPDLRFIFLYVGDSAYYPHGVKSPDRKYIEVFDTQTRKSLWRQNYSGDYRDYPKGVAFSSRGLIAICRDFNVTELRNAQSGVLLRAIERGQNLMIESEKMQFSPDGRLLALPRYDRLELWDVSGLS